MVISWCGALKSLLAGCDEAVPLRRRRCHKGEESYTAKEFCHQGFLIRSWSKVIVSLLRGTYDDFPTVARGVWSGHLRNQQRKTIKGMFGSSCAGGDTAAAARVASTAVAPPSDKRPRKKNMNER